MNNHLFGHLEWHSGDNHLIAIPDRLTSLLLSPLGLWFFVETREMGFEI